MTDAKAPPMTKLSELPLARVRRRAGTKHGYITISCGDARSLLDAIERLERENADLRELVFEGLYHLRLDERAKVYHEKAAASLSPSVEKGEL